MQITISNLKPHEERAIEALLAAWQRFGRWGHSDWTMFYADGDRSFRPKITVDGHAPRDVETGTWAKDRLIGWPESNPENPDQHEMFLTSVWAIDPDVVEDDHA